MTFHLHRVVEKLGVSSKPPTMPWWVLYQQ